MQPPTPTGLPLYPCPCLPKGIRWQEIQRQNFTRLEPLCDFLQLSTQQRQRLIAPSAFPLNLPRRLADKIAKGTLEDPLLKQFVPTDSELELTATCSLDPVEDHHFQITPRLLQKYAGRALLLPTGSCAMHCRYCFRQHYSYQSDPELTQELSWLQAHPEIEEIILSGGDPLSWDNRRLLPLLEALDKIPHLQRIRVHTRFPIGIPERLDGELLQACKRLRFPLWVVIHTNHPAEFDEQVWDALARWRRNSGVLLLSQSVLLRGVNDDLHTLVELCKQLVNHGIQPYYLHQLDPVQGADHFNLPRERGETLIRELRKHLPGYAVPAFAQEIPGAQSKTVF